MPSVAPVTAPRLPARMQPWDGGVLDDHEQWDELDLAGVVLAGHAARGAEIARSRVVDGDLSSARLQGLRIVDSELTTSNLANLMALDASMTRVAFTGCRLTGFSWPQATIEDVRFTDCLIDLAAFGFARLRRTVFEDCILRDADFRECRFEFAHFHRCDLTGAAFDGARFERSELRGCTLDDLRGVAGLRGAALEWSDVVGLAGTMASALGIGVIDED
jgi:uncharacterized protein YjbI with pentapeptide repeats